MKVTEQERLFKFTKYCIDASALINIGRYPGYPREVFPTIWNKLEKMVKTDELISHIYVYKEIEKREDPIYEWCKENKKMFKGVDECQIKEFQNIKAKYDPDYWNSEIKKSGSWADPWLIALSICEEAILVTDEKNIRNRIPYIANHFDIQCINLIDLFKRIGIKY